MLTALQAGAQNLPYTPVRGLLESDLLRSRPEYKVVPNPFDPAEQTVVVPALQPEVALLHGFKADSSGNVLLHGGQDGRLAALASNKVIVSVEELVERNLFDHPEAGAVLAEVYIDSVVLAPFGAHPAACPGYYELDVEAMQTYLKAATDADAFTAYLRSTVHECGGHGGYVELHHLDRRSGKE